MLFPHMLNRIIYAFAQDSSKATGRNVVKKTIICVAGRWFGSRDCSPDQLFAGKLNSGGIGKVTQAIAAAGKRLFKRTALILGVGLIVPALAGCGSVSIPGLSNTSSTTDPSETPSVASTSSTTSQATPIAFAPVIGAPPKVAKQLSSSLVSQAEQRNIKVSSGNNAKADYTVRGYLVASPDKKGTKLSYIWDVTDKSGKRAHRIKGEELVAGKGGSDPWSVVNKGAVDNIAKETAAKIATWLPKQNKVASQPKRPAPKQVAATNSKKPASPSVTSSTKKTKKTKKPATKPGVVYAMVPTVQGAPGDGKSSLTKAIKKQLYGKGIKLASSATPATYTVKGNVALSSPKSGKQDINIEWKVVDPNGKSLGVVSQKNTIPQGSLNGSWGKTADAAAAAAANGILKLLPKPK